MIRAARILFSGLVPILVAAACDTSPGYLREEGRRRHLESLGIERFDSGGAYALAGVSTIRRIELDALDPRKLRGDTLDPAYGVLLMRCGACHDVPAPDSKPAYLWESVVSRMKKNAQDAGLMPMDSSDEAAVLRFLREHAAEGR